MFPTVLLLKFLFIAYLIASVLTCVVLFLLNRYFKFHQDSRLAFVSKFLAWIIGGAASLVLFVFWDATLIEPNWIEIKKLSVPIRSGEAFKDLRIVEISDLHVERIGYREKALIKLVNGLEPDIILMNGDYVNGRDGWDKAFTVIKELKARLRVIAIIGNTDYYFANEQYIRLGLESLGVEVLIRGSVPIEWNGQKLWIVGVSDKWAMFASDGHEGFINEAFQGIPVNEPKIFMVHDPQHALTKTIRYHKPDLIIAGDTHGGQVGIPGLRKLWSYADRGEYMSGLYNLVGNIPLYVNRGIGMKTLNIRFLCRPELTVIELKGE